MTSQINKILFGTAYYDEYQPISCLDKDIDLMKEAHINVIRVGEGSWSHWEPEDGKFNLEWLKPVLDKAHQNGIQAIIGVPTFAIPQWLVRKYPQIAAVDSNGNRRFFGSREEHSLSDPVFKYYSQRVINKIVDQYKNHPAIIGWQLHNEPGLLIDYSPDVFEGFKDYLRNKYKSVENLNKQWGLVYWSHELSTWDDLWKPEGNAQPQYDIEWRHYQAQLTDNLLAWQSHLIKSKVPQDQFVTVNIDQGRSALDEAKSSEHLDVASSDIYYHMQDGMKSPNPDHPDSWFTWGPWEIAEKADRTYSLKQKPFCVAETDGGPIGGAGDNYPAYDGQWAQAGWQLVSRGAKMIEYWHWQQLHYGTETYWGGILPHDRKPGRVYKEIVKLGKSFSDAGDQVTDLKPDEDIAMLYSIKSRWGLSFEPYTARGAELDPHKTRNPQAYDHMFNSFYVGAFLSGKQVRIIHDSQIYDDEKDNILIDPQTFAEKHPTLMVVADYISSNKFVEWLADYVKVGGKLVLGPKTTYADDLARIRLDTKPAKLSEISNTSYQEFSNLRRAVPIIASKGFHLNGGAKAIEWIDCLCDSNEEDIVAKYDDPFFKNFPAITQQKVGKGLLTVIGTVPNKEFAKSIFEFLLPNNDWNFSNEHVTQSSAVNKFGGHLHFIFNWSWKPSKVKLPVKCTRLNDSNVITEIDLKAWDVAIVKELKD